MKNQGKDYRDTTPPRRFRSHYRQKQAIKIPQEEEEFRRTTSFRIYFTPKYKNISLGSCYSCNNFGHKAVNCRANTKDKRNDEGYTRNSYPRRSHEAQNKIYNILDHLVMR
jgi:hypothetical protein